MPKITREEARNRIANYGKSIQRIEHVFPGLEDLTGELGVVELSPKDIEDTQELAKGANGSSTTILSAAMVARGLVLYDTKERIFADNDVSIISDLGLSIFQVFSNEIAKISGISEDALEAARKNLSITQGSGSPSS